MRILIPIAGKLRAPWYRLPASSSDRSVAGNASMPSLTRRFIDSKSHNEDARPGDEQQTWTRKRLEKMNGRFTRKLKWAFRRGYESKASAAAAVELPMSPVPYFSAPPCPHVWIALQRTNCPAPLPD